MSPMVQMSRSINPRRRTGSKGITNWREKHLEAVFLRNELCRSLVKIKVK